MCLHDLFQISDELKSIGIFDIYFGASGRCLTHTIVWGFACNDVLLEYILPDQGRATLCLLINF